MIQREASIKRAQLYAKAGRFTAAFDILEEAASECLAGLPSESCLLELIDVLQAACLYGHIDLIEDEVLLQALRNSAVDRTMPTSVKMSLAELQATLLWSGRVDLVLKLFCAPEKLSLLRLCLARYIDRIEDINAMTGSVAARAGSVPAKGRALLRKKKRYAVWLHNSWFSSSAFRFFAAPVRQYLPDHGYEVIATVHGKSEEEGILSTGHLSDEDFCKAVMDRDVDIFIDYCGENSASRYKAFSKNKPAPIMINLGGVLSSGLPAFDYRLADRVCADPAGLLEWSSEKLLLHPVCFQPYRPPPDAPEIRPRAEGQPVVFGNFNQLPKINEQSVALWAEILQRLPQARMLFKQQYLEGALARLRLVGMFAERGIDAERLEFRGQTNLCRHLEALNEVDIVLDTIPFGGHTTCCEAMWMGKPVVNLRGDSLLIGRIGASYLTAAGHGDWVVDSKQAYIERAIDWAQAPERLAALRQEGRQQIASSPLCDEAGWVAHLARILNGIVEERLA